MFSNFTSWFYESPKEQITKEQITKEQNLENSNKLYENLTNGGLFLAAEEWQKKQLREHFTICKIFNNFLLTGQNYSLPEKTVIKSKNDKYYYYCFGNFTTFISNNLSFEELRNVIRTLLNLYDIGKGYSRLILGDPTHITILKNGVNVYSMSTILECDFTPFCYNYGKIHAHTMAQYSLSTLIMLIISHLVNVIKMKNTDNYNGKGIISPQICKNSYDNKVFQEFEYNTGMNVSLKENLLAYPDKILYCVYCKQACENLWGNFNCCLNCHLNEICIECGSSFNVTKKKSGYPYCNEHIKNV